jgi:hypothetical protein
MKWARIMRNGQKAEFAAQIKAGFSLTLLMKRFLS